LRHSRRNSDISQLSDASMKEVTSSTGASTPSLGSSHPPSSSSIDSSASRLAVANALAALSTRPSSTCASNRRPPRSGSFHSVCITPSTDFSLLDYNSVLFLSPGFHIFALAFSDWQTSRV
jgi:hypothetical protein